MHKNGHLYGMPHHFGTVMTLASKCQKGRSTEKCTLLALEAVKGAQLEFQPTNFGSQYLKNRFRKINFEYAKLTVLTQAFRLCAALDANHIKRARKRTFLEKKHFLAFCSLDFSSSLPIVHFWHPDWPLTSIRNLQPSMCRSFYVFKAFRKSIKGLRYRTLKLCILRQKEESLKCPTKVKISKKILHFFCLKSHQYAQGHLLTSLEKSPDL